MNLIIVIAFVSIIFIIGIIAIIYYISYKPSEKRVKLILKKLSDSECDIKHINIEDNQGFKSKGDFYSMESKIKFP